MGFGFLMGGWGFDGVLDLDDVEEISSRCGSSLGINIVLVVVLRSMGVSVWGGEDLGYGDVEFLCVREGEGGGEGEGEDE